MSRVDALAQAVGYQDFRDYLLARGWTSAPSRRDYVAIFRSPGSHEAEVQLPLETDLVDYADAISLAARRLAEYEGRHLEAVLRDLAMPRRDVVRYALGGEATTSTGSIRLQAGEAMLSGALKSLLASACSVKWPRRVHPRMTLTEAESFVRGCRLGQTEIGSFVLAIDAPLDIDNEAPSREPPFGRRVTRYLLTAVHQIATAIRRGEPNRIVDEPGEALVSANLCESLVEMMPTDESADLRLSSTWSALIPVPANLVSKVHLDRTMFEPIQRLAQQLRPARVGGPEQFVGLVVALSGAPNAAGQLEGDVVLQVQLEDQLPRVRVTLGSEAYMQAVTAHVEQRYVSVRGLLRRAGRSKLLENPQDFMVLAG